MTGTTFAHGDTVSVAQSAPSSIAPASANRTAVRTGTILRRWADRWNPASDYWAVGYPDGTVVIASGSMLERI